MAVNPWRETIFVDACRVCSKSFCCKSHRDTHEENTHGKIVPCVKSLPEICQKCNVFVSNIYDIKRDCVKVTNKRSGVLVEHSPNIVVDRPRKRTFSMMSVLTQQPSELKQDSSSITKRAKRQARKRISQSGKTSSSELAAVKKDSNEISPKFEEVKSSSTPILLDRPDLRVRLLKSKIEAGSNSTMHLLKPPSQHGGKRNTSDGNNAAALSEDLGSKLICQTPDDTEKSVYGTPGYGSLTPFIKVRRSYVRFSEGSSNDVSVYGTPKTSLLSVSESVNIISITSCTDSQDFSMSSKSDAQDIQFENEKLDEKRVVIARDDHTNSPSVEADVKETSAEVIAQRNERVVLGKMSSGSAVNENLSGEVGMDTSEIKPINETLGVPPLESSESLVDKEMELAEEFIAEGELQIVSQNDQEHHPVKVDCSIMSCSRGDLESAVEVIPPKSRRSFVEDKCVQPDRLCSTFVEPSKKESVVTPSCEGETKEHEEHAKDNFSKVLNSSSIRDTSSLLKTPVCLEVPSSAFHRTFGEDAKQVFSNESTPDSISHKISENQLSINYSLHFKSISSVTKDNLESPKFKQSDTPYTSKTSVNVSGSKKFKSAPETITESHFQSFIENKENLGITEHLEKNNSHFESFAEVDLFHKDQTESKHVYQTNIKSNSALSKNETSCNSIQAEVNSFGNAQLESNLLYQANITSNSKPNRKNARHKSIKLAVGLFHKDQMEPKHVHQANSSSSSCGQADHHSLAMSSTAGNSGSFASQPSAHLTSKQDPNIISSDLSVEWKSFQEASTNPLASAVESSGKVDSRQVSVGGENVTKVSTQRFMAEGEKEDSTQIRRDHLREADTESSSAIGENLRKNFSVGNFNLSGNCLFGSSFQVCTASVSTKLQSDHAQRFSVEDAPSSRLEDSRFELVAYHSTPMAHPLNRTSISLDEGSLDCTRSRQAISSHSSASSSKGFFGQAKKKIKSYFPYLFNAKSSKSTEDLHSSPLQARDSTLADATVLEVSRMQSSDQNTDSEIQLQGILKRRPIWSWPKRRQPIHENRVRIRDDSFDDTQLSE